MEDALIIQIMMRLKPNIFYITMNLKFMRVLVLKMNKMICRRKNRIRSNMGEYFIREFLFMKVRSVSKIETITFCKGNYLLADIQPC